MNEGAGILYERRREHRTGTDQKSTSCCSTKKSSRMAHASGGLATYCCPCGPHRRATVAGLRLVGGAVRPSQDARLLLPQALVLSMREQNIGKKGPKSKIFPSPGERAKVFPAAQSAVRTAKSRGGACANLPEPTGRKHIQSQRLRNGRRRDGPEHRQKPECARREIAMYQRPFERRSLPLLLG